MMRRVFKQLERPEHPDPCASDTWQHPDGHSTQYAYQYFTGGWGTWKLMHVDLVGPQQWVFVPFNDQQEQVGAVGRMIYTQHHQPVDAVVGSAWLCPNKSFKRVLSRGGAWENVQLGQTHPDEVDHAAEQRAEAQPGDESPAVSDGTGESASGNGDDGEALSESSGDGEENTGVMMGFGLGQEAVDRLQQGEEAPSVQGAGGIVDGSGVDGNGSPVV